MSRKCERVPSWMKIPNVMDISTKDGFFRTMIWQRIKRTDMAKRIQKGWDDVFGFCNQDERDREREVIAINTTNGQGADWPSLKGPAQALSPTLHTCSNFDNTKMSAHGNQAKVPAPPALEHIHSSEIKAFIKKWRLNEAAETTLHSTKSIPLARKIMESFNPRSSRVLKSVSRKSKQLQSFVRTKAIQNMLAEQTTLNVGQQVRITQLIRNLERTNTRRTTRSQKDESHTDEPKLRDPITPKSEFVFSSSPPIQENASPAEASPPSTLKQCTQSTKKGPPKAETTRKPSRMKDDESLEDPDTRIRRMAGAPTPIRIKNDEFLDDESLEDEDLDTSIKTITNIKGILEKARPEETMAFVIAVDNQTREGDYYIKNALREQFALHLDCYEHQVSVSRPTVYEMFYEIEVSAQGDEDITQQHRKWSGMLTDWRNLYSLHLELFLNRRCTSITEIHLQNGTWMFAGKLADHSDPPMGVYMGNIGWYKRVKDVQKGEGWR